MFRSIAAAAALLAVPSNAMAQYDQAADQRVSLGIAIPFGHGGTAQERKPRLEIGFDHRARRQSFETAIVALDAPSNPRARLGLSLSQNPQLLLNGREMEKLDGQRQISTLAWIGIGLAATAGIGMYVVYRIGMANSE
jgi:hypothetical protein